MAQAARDENQVVARPASFGGVTSNILADHATGYIRIKISAGSLSATSQDADVSEIDENSIASATGSYNGTTKTLMADHTTGYLKLILA